jgi:hypothetical protein
MVEQSQNEQWGNDPFPFTDPRLEAAYHYWRAKVAGRSMPSRTDIDPIEIPKLLPYIMLVDVLESGRYRYRLVGTALEREQGVNATGRYLDEVIPGVEYKAHIIGLYDECLRERRPLYSERLFFSLRAQTADYHVKALLMPLSDDEDRINMVIVAALFEYIEQEAHHRHFLDTVPYREIVRVLVLQQNESPWPVSRATVDVNFMLDGHARLIKER